MKDNKTIYVALLLIVLIGGSSYLYINYTKSDIKEPTEDSINQLLFASSGATVTISRALNVTTARINSSVKVSLTITVGGTGKETVIPIKDIPPFGSPYTIYLANRDGITTQIISYVRSVNIINEGTYNFVGYFSAGNASIKNATITGTNSLIVIKDADVDGVKDSLDQCSNTAAGSTVNSNGCATYQLDADSDGVMDNVDNCISIDNTNQANCDGDAYGNLCDASSPCSTDTDSDGVMDNSDDCPLTTTSMSGTISATGCKPTQLQLCATFDELVAWLNVWQIGTYYISWDDVVNKIDDWSNGVGC